MSRMIDWDPKRRLKGLEALMHPYFDELREEGLLFPNGNCLPDVLNFTQHEFAEKPEPSMVEQLIPEWYQKQKNLTIDKIFGKQRVG